MYFPRSFSNTVLLALYFHFTCPHPEINFGQGTSVLLAFCLHFMPREIGMIKAIDDGPYSAYPATKLNRFPIFIHRPGMFFYSWANPPYRIDLISPTFFINIDLISSDL
jgi:hypothetical protein